MSDMIGVIVAASIAALAFFGWGNNIYKLYNYSDQMETGQVVIRGVGIPIAPLGIVMGYINE